MRLNIHVSRLALLFCLFLAACGNLPSSATAAVAPTATDSPTSTALPTPAATPTDVPAPAKTPEATSPVVSPPPSETPQASLSEQLLEIIDSEAWPIADIDEAQVQRWEKYARTGRGLSSTEEQQYIGEFVTQWQTLNAAAEAALVPKNAKVEYRAKIVIHETGGNQPVLYAAVGGDQAQDGEQLFLIGRDAEGSPKGLLAAPQIDGLFQRISTDGQWVEYVDEVDGVTRLIADARQILPDGDEVGVLLAQLRQEYRMSHGYVRAELFPRFKFPEFSGVGASFYTVEKMLSRSQIVQMTEAFDLLSRPNFAPFKEAMFGENTSVTILKRSDEFLGATMLGTGVMQLNRRDLLGDKYLLVSVLVHEGAHILQSRPSPGGDACKKSLRREVGDHSVPDGFFDWSAEQVIEGIRKQTIGAYHAGFWVLDQLGLLGSKPEYRPDWRELIQTGKSNGYWVSMYCDQ